MLARGAPFIAEAPVNDDGSFEFSRVPPGSYSVVIRGAAAVTRIQVGEKDVTGIELKVPLILFPEGSYRPVPNDVPQGYTVTSIKRGSLDMMKEPLKIPSDDTSEIVVTISSQH